MSTASSSSVTLIFGVMVFTTMGGSIIGESRSSVHVINHLSSNHMLIGHCQSGDDDLKAQKHSDKRLSFVAFQDWVGEYPDSVYWVVEDDGVHKMYNDTDPVIVSFRGSLERIECCFSSERSN
ncbi:hypothetical protein LINPERHAP2_LOCUS11161 [Linum perenne]